MGCQRNARGGRAVAVPCHHSHLRGPGTAVGTRRLPEALGSIPQDGTWCRRLPVCPIHGLCDHLLGALHSSCVSQNAHMWTKTFKADSARRAETKYGLGLPLALRPKDDLVSYTRVNFAGRPFYQLGISFFKLALLFSYRRLLNGISNRTYRWVVEGTAVLIFLGHLGCTFSLIFACSPVRCSSRRTEAC